MAFRSLTTPVRSFVNKEHCCLYDATVFGHAKSRANLSSRANLLVTKKVTNLSSGGCLLLRGVGTSRNSNLTFNMRRNISSCTYTISCSSERFLHDFLKNSPFRDEKPSPQVICNGLRSSRQNNIRFISSQSSPTTLANPQRFAEPLKWSYASVNGEQPLLGLTMGKVISRARDQFGDREAVVSVAQDVRATYDQLFNDSAGLAAGLLGSGLQVGDRVGLWSGNCYEWVVTQWAAGLAGLVLVNINPSYVASELLYCLRKVDVKALVMAPAFKDTDLYSVLLKVCPQLSEAVPNDLSCPDLPNLKSVVVMGDEHKPGTTKFWDVSGLRGGDPAAALRPLEDVVQFDQPCNIQFTSGTTGNPKAAMLSHHNLVNNGYFIGLRNGYHLKPFRICLPVPLYHCFGCVAGSIAGALYGATCILPSPNFSPRAAYRALVSERVTSCYGTPTMFVDILAAARNSPVAPENESVVEAQRGGAVPSSLETGIMAGAPCPPELVQAVISELGMRDFVVMYGLTETSPVCLQCSPSDPPHTRSLTVGYPGDHLEAKVVDADGRVVRTGEEGELLIRGYAVFLGYWGDEAKTKEVIGEDRWFKTGDLAAMDESGYCSIRGRKKDMIIRGGENIYPAELENIFMTHPQVLEVQVFGIPDARLGEVVVAWLRLQEGSGNVTQEQFQLWCRDRVAAYKVPSHVMVRDAFPVTVTGKIQKFRMREETIQELNRK